MSPRPFLLLFLNPTIAFAPGAAAAQSLDSPAAQIQVRLYDYADAPRGILGAAIAIAENVFRPAGIAIEWIDCTPALKGVAAPASCRDLSRPTSLMIQILPRKMSAKAPVSRRVLGYAVVANRGQYASRASVFYDRIKDHCEAYALEADALLGMALAHEIGHLMLGKGSHSETGLMRCPWTNQDIKEAARGRLRFTLGELSLAHTDVLARVRADRRGPVF